MKHFDNQDDAIKAVLRGWGDDTTDAAYSDARDLVLALRSVGLLEWEQPRAPSSDGTRVV